MSCAECEYAFTEAWQKGQSALRCGNEASGHRRGYVTEIFPTGHIVVIAARPEPAWCPLRKEKTV